MAKVVQSPDDILCTVQHLTSPTSHDIICEMLEAIDMLDIMENEYGLVFEEGGKGWWNTHCPLPGHMDSNPSFGVNPELKIFKCFACGNKGDFLTFIQKVEGLNFPQALRRLSEMSGVGLEEFDDDNGAGRTVRDITAVARLSREAHGITNLPLGATIESFMLMLAREYRRYERRVGGDLEEIAWVDSVYARIDKLADQEKFAEISRVWNNRVQERRERIAAFKARGGILIEEREGNA